MINTENEELNVEIENVLPVVDIDDSNVELDINTLDVDIDSQVEPLEIESDVLRVCERDHSILKNLDFESSGHTGFQPAGNYVEDEKYVHTDNNYTNEEKNKLRNLQNFSGNASDVIYQDDFGYGVNNVQEALNEAFNSLDTKAEVGDFDNYVSYNKQNKIDKFKEIARKNINAKKDVIDLGYIDLEEYDYDYTAFMATLLTEGEYKFHDDDFNFYINVIKVSDTLIGQSYCSSEEGYVVTYYRDVYLDEDGIFDYTTDFTNYLSMDTANNVFAGKTHMHYKYITTNEDIRDYLDNNFIDGESRIKSQTENEEARCYSGYFNVNINGKLYYKRFQKYYTISEPWIVYSRVGLYNSATKKIAWQDWYFNEGVIE